MIARSARFCSSRDGGLSTTKIEYRISIGTYSSWQSAQCISAICSAGRSRSTIDGLHYYPLGSQGVGQRNSFQCDAVQRESVGLEPARLNDKG